VSRLSVIALSQAFQGFWNDLALDLGTAIDLVGPAEAVTSSPEMAAVIVAAGGAERDAVQWLESHPVPAGVPALVVGTDPGRRTAMQLVTHGASDYFALPDDLEIFRVPEYLDRVPEYLRATTSPSRTISRYSGTRSPPRSTPPGRGP